jgi:hypothetical protein
LSVFFTIFRKPHLVEFISGKIAFRGKRILDGIGNFLSTFQHFLVPISSHKSFRTRLSSITVIVLSVFLSLSR